jgi:hypothetical protein
VILVISDNNSSASLGGRLAAATRTALIRRLRDPKLWVVPQPFENPTGVEPPDSLPLSGRRERRSPALLDIPLRASETTGSALWGASCPRQGNSPTQLGS